jgi:subtilase family serine protease
MLNRLKRKTGCVRRRQSSLNWAPAVEALEDRRLLSNTPSPTALTPAQVRSYYGFDQINFTYYATFQSRFGPIFHRVTAPGDGTGQTIAIIDKYYDPNIQNDVNVFDTQFNLPAPNLIIDKLPSVTTTDPTGNWENEESIDVEWAHAIAPAASIVVINCGTTNPDFLKAVNVAANYPSVSVVSMSLGGTESQGELANDSYFTNPTNHDGINVSFVASSGDDKSTQGPGPLYPSVSPNVLAVGGTVLTLSSNGNSEVSWQDSEGGQSAYEPEPSYQEFVQQTGFRTTPDVAYAATNFAAYDSFPVVNAGQSIVLDWHTPQGTSLGAPQWAALIAIANQGRTLYGEPTLSNVPSELYSLPATDFNDITSGPANREGYSPGPGYDEITGLGTPKANKLVPDLVNQPPTLLPPWIWQIVQIWQSFGGDFNDFMFTPQAQVMQGSLASSALDGSLGQFAGLNLGSLLSAGMISSTPTAANLINAQAPTSANGSEGWAFWSTRATGSVSASGLRAQLGLDSLARLTPGDGLLTDSKTASLAEGVQWAGLKAALEMLSV